MGFVVRRSPVGPGMTVMVGMTLRVTRGIRCCLRQGDFHIGNGFYMNDYIMGIDI